MQAASAAPVEHHGFYIPRNLAWRTGRLDQFRETSEGHISHLRRYADLDGARDIVEIGCGVGRDAIPLTKILPKDGSYLGIDIIRPSIEWATANISAVAPNFEFAHFDVGDQQHNPGGSSAMESHAIPRADASQDLIFLFSVFTHMFPDDIAHYLSEFARVLRPRGCVLVSMFTMDRDLIPNLRSAGGGGLRNLTFAHEIEEGFFHNDPKVVPGATAYSPKRFGAAALKAGLCAERFVRGSWRKDAEFEVAGQDIIVLRRPAF